VSSQQLFASGEKDKDKFTSVKFHHLDSKVSKSKLYRTMLLLARKRQRLHRDQLTTNMDIEPYEDEISPSYNHFTDTDDDSVSCDFEIANVVHDTTTNLTQNRLHLLMRHSLFILT